MTILQLNGKDLDKEIDKIAKEYQSRNRPWTSKEILVLMRLRDKRVPLKKIAGLLNRTYDSVQQKVKRL